ncbi:MAG: hypothetical protein ABSA11_09065 [Candidatus Bathyarchaeia archaeon]
MKDTGQMEFSLSSQNFKRSCREPPVSLTDDCRKCNEYRRCLHYWRLAEHLEDF